MSFGDASGLRIVQRVNGKPLQDSNTNELIFGVTTLVARASAVFTLERATSFSPA